MVRVSLIIDTLQNLSIDRSIDRLFFYIDSLISID